MDPIVRKVRWLHSLSEEERKEYLRDIEAAIRPASEMPRDTLE